MSNPRPSLREQLATKDGGQPASLMDVDAFLDGLRQETVELERRLAVTLGSLFKSPVLPWDDWLLAVSEHDANRAALGIPVHMERRDIVQMLGSKRGFSRSVHELLARRLDLIFQMVGRTLAHPFCSTELNVFSRSVEGIRRSVTDKDGAAYYRLNAKSLLDHIAAKTHQKDDFSKYYHTFYDPYHILFLEALDEIRGEDSSVAGNNIVDTAKTLFTRMIEKRKGIPTGHIPYLWFYAEQLYWRSLSEEECEKCCADSIGRGDIQIGKDVIGSLEKLRKAVKIYADREVPLETDRISSLDNASAFHALAILKFNQLSNRSVEQDRLRRIRNYGGLDEYLEYESSLLLAVPTALTAIAYAEIEGKASSDPMFDVLQASATRYLKSVFTDHGSDALFFMPDNGHLYFMSLRLWAVQMFWLWDHVFWAMNTESKSISLVEAGTYYGNTEDKKTSKANSGKYYAVVSPCDDKVKWARPIARLITERPIGVRRGRIRDYLPTLAPPIAPSGGSVSFYAMTDSKADSVMILGGAGMGKTKLVESWYKHNTKNENEEEKLCSFVPLTPMNLPSNLADVLQGNACGDSIMLQKARSYVEKYEETVKPTLVANKGSVKHVALQHLVVFVDEIHIEDNGNPFAKLLIPLEDGIGFVYRTNEGRESKHQVVRFVFATSKYSTKEEFIAASIATNNTPMRDFATRIGHWIELPPLTTMPEQRAVLSRLKYDVEKGKAKEIAKGKGMSDSDAEKVASGEAEKYVKTVYLDLRLKSARDLKRGSEPNASTPEVFPVWAKDLFKVVPAVDK
jgi:hypothetical protein